MIKFKWTPRFAQIDLKYATVTIVDGTAVTPLELEIKIGEGNLTWTETRNIEYILDRGLLDEVREGDQAPVELSFDFNWSYLSGTGIIPSPNEALTQTGIASTWVSSDTDLCRPYAVDIVVLYIPTNCAASEQETITFADFRVESLAYDLREATIAASGKCNILRPTAVRAAQP